MEPDELIAIWQSSDAKISEAGKWNKKTLALILSQKVTSALNSLLRQRTIELIFHSIALVLLFVFFLYHVRELPYAVSAFGLIVFYGFLFGNCFQQIQLIAGIEDNKSIISRQQTLMKIQTHLLHFIRLSVLFIPVFLSYPVVVSKALADLNLTALSDFDILKKSNGTWWYAECITYIVLIPLGLWFYREVSIKNMHKAWVARIIKKSSSARVSKAIEYLNELNDLTSPAI